MLTALTIMYQLTFLYTTNKGWGREEKKSHHEIISAFHKNCLIFCLRNGIRLWFDSAQIKDNTKTHEQQTLQLSGRYVPRKPKTATKRETDNKNVPFNTWKIKKAWVASAKKAAEEFRSTSIDKLVAIEMENNGALFWTIKAKFPQIFLSEKPFDRDSSLLLIV